jgi:V-type H+-transporting ATPase subunit a
LDGIWGKSDNELTMTNSIKMKLSIVIGVCQMTFGILLKGVNNIISGSVTDFVCEFIPQLIFMMATFGYMTFLIIVKWLTPYPVTSEAPSIITTLLNMGFQLGGVSGSEMFPEQATI